MMIITKPQAAISTPSVFALVACQRSGTHLLREILNSNPAIAILSEPFSPPGADICWGNFVETLPKDSFPPAELSDALNLVDHYVASIDRDVDQKIGWYGGKKARHRWVGLDLKYNQLHSVVPLFLDLLAAPVLLTYFRTRRTPIVHLIRENLVHAALSIVIANLRSVWQNYDGSSLEGQFHVPPAELFQYMRWIRDERREFVRLTRDLQIHTSVYEDVAADLSRVDAAGAFPRDTRALKKLAEFLDVSNEFSYNRRIHKVVNRPYAEILGNHRELVDALRSSEFSEYATTL